MSVACTHIRPAVSADFDAVAAIYGHHVLHGTGTFETEPPDAADMRQRWQGVTARGLPWLVAHTDAGDVLGYAYCNWYHPRAAWHWTVEDSIYLAPRASGQGLGTRLLQALMQQAEQAGMRRMIAVIGDSGNLGSIGVHRRCGFNPAGLLPAVGWKFDRWIDVVLMERALGDGNRSAPPAP